MTPATLYTVNGPRGVYYAVRNNLTGKIFTERTDVNARQQAEEEGLAIVADARVTHMQLLDLMAPQTPHAPQPQAPAAPEGPTRVEVRRVQRGIMHRR